MKTNVNELTGRMPGNEMLGFVLTSTIIIVVERRERSLVLVASGLQITILAQARNQCGRSFCIILTYVFSLGN